MTPRPTMVPPSLPPWRTHATIGSVLLGLGLLILSRARRCSSLPTTIFRWPLGVLCPAQTPAMTLHLPLGPLHAAAMVGCPEGSTP